MSEMLEKLHLRYNPFEPSATGIGILKDLWIPDKWLNEIAALFKRVENGQGPRSIIIIGEYGSGKTYLLRWLESNFFPKQTQVLKTFFFENPGVRFYDLANKLFHVLGREDFTKALWEYLRPDLSEAQVTLFPYKFCSD